MQHPWRPSQSLLSPPQTLPQPVLRVVCLIRQRTVLVLQTELFQELGTILSEEVVERVQSGHLSQGKDDQFEDQ
jgi:hypothetical protein